MPVVLWVLFCVLLVFFLVLLGSSLFFYRVAILRRRKEFLDKDPALAVEQPEKETKSTVPWINEQSFEVIEIKAHDGLSLRAYYLPADPPTTRTAILAHGYGGTARENMGLFAQLYVEQFGFNVLLPDARGHGISEGNYIGFGWHERRDYQQWIDLVLQRDGVDAQIVLHGVSMGGATVLMTGGEPLPQQVKCIISDCSYTSAVDILSYQVTRMYKLPPFPFVPLTSLVCKLKAGYFFSEASALKQVSKAQLPILFIHGSEDTFVPTAMVHRLYEACQSYKELLLIAGAGHGVAYIVNPTDYIRKMKPFLLQFVPQTAEQLS